jgi:tetratricopeptide (TPR) repeat protein
MPTSSGAPAAAPAVAAAANAFSALSLSTNEREHPCWGCGKPAPPTDRRAFERCVTCAESRYAVCARFCGIKCYKMHRTRHKEWHKKKDADMAQSASQPNLESLRQETAELAAAAEDEYERLYRQAEHATCSGDPKAAVKLAKQAIELDPDRPEAHFALGTAYASCCDDLRASERYLSAMEREEPDSSAWKRAVVQAWDARRLAAPCGSRSLFCECERCAALPEKPAWMSSPQAVAAMAERVVAALPEETGAWRMHGYTHWRFDWSVAAKSCMKAGKMFGEQGHATHKAECLQNARTCLEHLRK